LPQRYSTRKSYLSNIRLHIRPRWEQYLIHQIRPMVVEGWLKKLDMAPKSKAHIRSVMHLMFECAARWELFNDRRNPMQIVRVKDSKRRQRPVVLTLPSDRDPETAHPPGSLLPSGVPELWCACRRLVLARASDAKRQAPADSRGAPRLCRQVQP
jgi:hypothetical protein